MRATNAHCVHKAWPWLGCSRPGAFLGRRLLALARAYRDKNVLELAPWTQAS